MAGKSEPNPATATQMGAERPYQEPPAPVENVKGKDAEEVLQFKIDIMAACDPLAHQVVIQELKGTKEGYDVVIKLKNLKATFGGQAGSRKNLPKISFKTGETFEQLERKILAVAKGL